MLQGVRNATRVAQYQVHSPHGACCVTNGVGSCGAMALCCTVAMQRSRLRSRSRSRSPAARGERGGRGGYGGRGSYDDRPGRGRGRRRRDADDDADVPMQWGKPEADDGVERPAVVEKPNFGLSGALAKDTTTGNVYKGIVLKWSEPADARAPSLRWRLYVFKDDEQIGKQRCCIMAAVGGEASVAVACADHSCNCLQPCFISTGSLLFWLAVNSRSALPPVLGVGSCDVTNRLRPQIADIHVAHPSCSSQHAVIQFRLKTKTDEEGKATREVRCGSRTSVIAAG